VLGAHHVDHIVEMRCIPRPYSGLGRQSWTRACVGRPLGRPDCKFILKKRKKKEGSGGCSVVMRERRIVANGQDAKGFRRGREEEDEVSESDFDWPRLIIHQGASSVYTCLPVAASSAEEYNCSFHLH